MPVARKWRANRSSVVALIVASVAMTPLVGLRAWRIGRDAGRAAMTLASTSPDERRLAAYGDCGGRGYGYLTRVLDGIPDDTVMPVVRYPDFDRYGRLTMLAARGRIESSIVVGIGLTPAQMEERRLTAARVPDAQGLSTWRFQTTDDLEVMDGFTLTLAEAATLAPELIRVTLYEQADRRRVLGQWDFRAPPDRDNLAGFVVDLPSPLTPFSIGRGGTDFLIDILAAGEVAAVAIRARIADLRGFDIVHRQADCFTAVRADALREMRGSSSWAPWLDGLSQR